MRRLVVGIIGGGVLLGGCVLLTDLDGVSGGADGDAPNDGGAPLDAGADAVIDDAGSTSRDASAEDACPAGRGARMVRAATFCIDATEATVDEYAQFLAAMASLPDRGQAGQPASCAWNADFKPAYWWPRSPSESGLTAAEIAAMPVAVADWCDARAFCEWAGKRLCGAAATGGGPLSPAQAGTVASEWYLACSHNGLTKYPYGDTYEDGACNDGRSAATEGRERVGSNAGCTGGYPGIVDMSGNLQEWIDACEAPAGEDASVTECILSGGSWNFPGSAVSCGSTNAAARGRGHPQGGIRCCATP